MSKRKGKIVEAHFAADFLEQTGKLVLGRHAAHVTHKRIDPVEHPPSRRTAQTLTGPGVPSRRRPGLPSLRRRAGSQPARAAVQSMTER